MADDTNILQSTDSIVASVGQEDGALITDDNNQYKVVYDYDDNDQFLGWHKEGTI